MQTQPNQLIRQQMILKELGFYTGPLDGIWGPDAIEAMKRFENRLDIYRPARPSCGLPFADGARLPAGLWFSRDGLVCSDKVPEEPSQKELDARVEFDAKAARARRPKSKAGAVTEVADTVDEEDEQTPAESPIKLDEPKPQQQQNHQQKNKR